MRETASRINPLQAELPAFSADWRFLLPTGPGARILVLSDRWQDFSPYFAELRMQVVGGRIDGAGSPADFPRQGPTADAWATALVKQLPFAAGSFDAVVIPLGIPEELGALTALTDQIGSWKRLLRPGGVLLLGFSNQWGFLRRGRRMGIAVTPASIKRRLQEAGFARFSLYAAVPNLDKPAYILPLRERPLQFFLRHRLLGRRGGVLLRIIPTPILARLMPGFLPSYLLLAGA